MLRAAAIYTDYALPRPEIGGITIQPPDHSAAIRQDERTVRAMSDATELAENRRALGAALRHVREPRPQPITSLKRVEDISQSPRFRTPRLYDPDASPLVPLPEDAPPSNAPSPVLPGGGLFPTDGPDDRTGGSPLPGDPDTVSLPSPEPPDLGPEPLAPMRDPADILEPEPEDETSVEPDPELEKISLRLNPRRLYRALI